MSSDKSNVESAGFQTLLASDQYREAVLFVLSALLQSNCKGPVYLFAPAELCVACAASASNAVPWTQIGSGWRFAFPEGSLLQSDAPVICSWSEKRGDDLPDECYVAPSAGFNTRTGRRSDHVPTVPYAEFAVAQLAGGRSLDAFVQLCLACRVQSADDLQDLFALENSPARLEFPRLVRLIDNPATLPRVRQSPAALQRCKEWLNATLRETGGQLAANLRRAERVNLPKGELLAALERLIAALDRE